MKALFLIVFLAITAAFGGAAVYSLSRIPPRSWTVENAKDRAFDWAEALVLKVSGLVGPKLSEELDRRLGTCQLMTLPEKDAVNPIANVKPLPGPVEFSRTIETGKNSLLCSFPDRGKPVLLVPHGKMKFLIRRRPDQAGVLQFTGDAAGDLLLVSDQIDFTIAVPGIKLHLHSAKPASVTLTYDRAEPLLTLLAMSGDLDFTIERSPEAAEATFVTLKSSPNSSLSSDGKKFSPNEPIKILPSGIYEGEARDPLPGSAAHETSPAAAWLSWLARARPGTPERSTVQMILSKLEVSDYAWIIRFADYLPGLFGIHFVCRFRSLDKNLKPLAVLPGEWVNAPVGGALYCANRYDLELAKDTRLRVLQSGLVPHFQLASGEAKVTFGEADLFVETPALSAGVRGNTTAQQITFSSRPGQDTIGCLRGLMTLGLHPKEGKDAKILFIARQCRMEMITEGSNRPQYVTSGERVYYENLAIARKFWPVIPDSALPSFALKLPPPCL